MWLDFYIIIIKPFKFCFSKILFLILYLPCKTVRMLFIYLHSNFKFLRQHKPKLAIGAMDLITSKNNHLNSIQLSIMHYAPYIAIHSSCSSSSSSSRQVKRKERLGNIRPEDITPCILYIDLHFVSSKLTHTFPG